MASVSCPALREQAPDLDLQRAPVVILGAGGAARGAASALIAAEVPEVRLCNRTQGRAEILSERLGARVKTFPLAAAAEAFIGAGVIINSTPPEAMIHLAVCMNDLPSSVVAMDMVYRPVKTPFLAQAEAHRMKVVDGLAMLIAQARPAFSAIFGCPPPEIDVRRLALSAMEAA